MSYNPPPTASGRPGTSTGARPTTAYHNPANPFHHSNQFGVVDYGDNDFLEEDEGEGEDESEDEDVFAFLAPTTAEQQLDAAQLQQQGSGEGSSYPYPQQQQYQQYQQQQQSQHPFAYAYPTSTPTSTYTVPQTADSEVDYGQVSGSADASSSLPSYQPPPPPATPPPAAATSTEAELTYPSPTFDPYSRQTQGHPYAYPHNYPSYVVRSSAEYPGTPPSTDSMSNRGGEDLYRMRRMGGDEERRSSEKEKEQGEDEGGKGGDKEGMKESGKEKEREQEGGGKRSLEKSPLPPPPAAAHLSELPAFPTLPPPQPTNQQQQLYQQEDDDEPAHPSQNQPLPQAQEFGYTAGGARKRRGSRRTNTNTTNNTPRTAGSTTGRSSGTRLGTGVSVGRFTSRSGRTGTSGKGDVDGESLGSYGYESGYGEGDDESREGSIKMEFDFDAIDDEDSPYPEVRASVSNIDDPEMPAMTIRMWFVGLILCMTSSALNVFFNFRSPAPSIVPLALLLVSYPCGKFLAFTLPITTYRIPLPHFSPRFLPSNLPLFLHRLLRPMTFPHALEFSLNPGPWNIKEHVLVFIMANVAVGNPYALNAVVVLEVFYEFKTGYWFSLVLVLATQLTGFGLAGMCRRFLVWPASMVWPQNLVACTLLNTLHAEDEDDGIGMMGGLIGGGALGGAEGGGEAGRKIARGMSRYKFFMLTTLGSFVWFFFPGYIFEALSVFSFVCWAAPKNVPVNQLFGISSGLGMSILTFDWTQISWIGSPLMVPWWAEVHIFAGFVLFYWIMTPALYYTNSWKLGHFPISANQPYDRFGNVYDITRVLKPDDTFNETAYNEYSPLYLPATYAVTYLLAFCLSTCVIVHTVLYHGRTLLNGFKKIRVENDDIHAKLMRNYPEVPDWWYLCAFCVFFSLAIVAVEVWDTSVPVWALLLSIALPVIYILPSGFIYAMTGQGINLNILAQIIPGTLLPGQPLANMVFKAYSVQTLSEATSFVQDLKLGHYVKVPPRATFLVQLVATTLAAFVQVGVKQWIFDNVHDICQKDQPSQLTCPHNMVFFTASAVWGLIGPTRQFGTGSIYHPHLYAIIVGVFLPIPFWLWRRRYPNSWVKWVSTPVVLNGVSWIPPATGINYSSWFAVGFIFQYVVRKRNFAWWSKFNYVLSSALDSGTVIAVVLIFFTVQFPKGGFTLKWWGNTVHTQTADWKRTPWLAIPEGGIPWKNAK